MAEGDWVTVGGKNKPRKLGHTRAPAPVQPVPSAQAPSQARIDRMLNLAADAQREVAASRFYAGLKAVLSESSLPLPGGPVMLLSCDSMVMWGLGSLESSLVHIRYQLALARLLRELLGGSEVGVEAYDPVFTALDKAVLEASSMQVSSENINGRHVASHPTLFYLPHCELELTEQLLSANVAVGTLCNVAILGNSFSLYKERWELKRGSGAQQRQPGSRGIPSSATHQGAQQGCRGPSTSTAQQGSGETSSSEAQESGGGALSSTTEQGQQSRGTSQLEALSRPQGLLYHLCLCGGVEERPVGEAGFPVSSAFNDMALHTFSADWQEKLSCHRGL